jgi:hypothetical protein
MQFPFHFLESVFIREFVSLNISLSFRMTRGAHGCERLHE